MEVHVVGAMIVVNVCANVRATSPRGYSTAFEIMRRIVGQRVIVVHAGRHRRRRSFYMFRWTSVGLRPRL